MQQADVRYTVHQRALPCWSGKTAVLRLPACMGGEGSKTPPTLCIAPVPKNAPGGLKTRTNVSGGSAGTIQRGFKLGMSGLKPPTNF